MELIMAWLDQVYLEETQTASRHERHNNILKRDLIQLFNQYEEKKTESALLDATIKTKDNELQML